MKQKLAIARALIHRPSLVFFDEPTAGLDPEATVALRRDIAALGTTVFLTTHNLADVEKMATHVAVIRAGRLLDFGTPAELRKRAMRSHVTIRMQDRQPMLVDVAPDESVAPLVTRLVQRRSADRGSAPRGSIARRRLSAPRPQRRADTPVCSSG